METVLKSSLISCLLSSHFAQMTEDEELQVPKRFVINQIIINNDNDLDSLLNKLRFWGIKIIPHEVYEYIMNPSFTSKIDFPSLGSDPNESQIDFKKYNYSLYEELEILTCIRDKNELLEAIAENKKWDLLIYFLGHKRWQIKKNILQKILDCGGKDTMIEIYETLNSADSERKWMEVYRCPFDMTENIHEMIDCFIALGDVALIKYLFRINNIFTFQSASIAARGGHYDMLVYVNETQYYGDALALNNVYIGIFGGEKDLRKQSYYSVIAACIYSKNIKCFRYLIDQGVDIKEIRKWVKCFRDRVPEFVSLMHLLKLW